MQAKPGTVGQCGCGRSPTGRCCGWHALTEEMYRQSLMKYIQEQKLLTDPVPVLDGEETWAQQTIDESDQIEAEKQDELDRYRQEAMDLWFDGGGGCTGGQQT